MSPLLLLPSDLISKAPGEHVIALSETTEENYYAIARFIMQVDEWLLNFVGMGHSKTLFIWVYAVSVFILALVIGQCFTWIIVKTTRLIGRKVNTDIYIRLRQQRFFIRACRIVTPIVFLILIQFTLVTRHSLAAILSRLTWIYILCIVTMSICTLTNVVWEHIDARENKQRLPLRGLLQLVKGVLWLIALIICCAILFNKSPATLLTGLGAFAAVLMLIFKDSILGVVAGVQLSENDSLHVGDWIKVNGTDANGTVIEVTLTTVKVRNWDKTITTIPPYTLVSGSFTNYRDMQQSSTRRIQRSYMIDADSVVPADEALLSKWSEIPLLKDWISKKMEQRKAGKVEDVNNSDGLVDGSIETNLGVFRAYLKLYLDANPNVCHAADGISFCFVTTLAQTAAGIPLQLYCFTNTSAWLSYEAIQASIIEHVAVMLAQFNLYTFENPSGRDTIIDGYMSPGKNSDVLFGLPYPFFRNGGTPGNPASPMPRSAYSEPTAMQVPQSAPVPPISSTK